MEPQEGTAPQVAAGPVVEVGAVASGQDHLGEAGPVGGEQLLLHATDGQHPSLQRDLTGHGHVGLHVATGEQADQRGGHGDAGRRPVLRHRPGGEVHVDVAAVGALGDPERVAVGPHVGEGDPRRLLHDVAQLTGDRERGAVVSVWSVGRHGGGLHEEDVAAGTGDRESGRHAGHLRANRWVLPVGRRAEGRSQVVDPDVDHGGLGFASQATRSPTHQAVEPLHMLDRLIALAPENLHVILAARQPVELPSLLQWRVRGEVLEIDEPDSGIRTAGFASIELDGTLRDVVKPRRELHAALSDDARYSMVANGAGSDLSAFPPDLLPFDVERAMVPGYDAPLPLYDVTMEDGSTRQLAQVRA